MDQAMIPQPQDKRAAIALVEGTFWLLTGIWPLVHMPSFLAVTGPKHDLWLVRTLGVLISVVALTLLVAGCRRRVTAEIVLLAAGGALGLAAIDVIYSLSGVIWKTYLIDAAVEMVIVALWLWALRTRKAVAADDA